MKRITIDISEEQYNTFMAFINTLDYVSVPQVEAYEWQKKIVRERIKNTNLDDYVSWNDIEKQIKFD